MRVWLFMEIKLLLGKSVLMCIHLYIQYDSVMQTSTYNLLLSELLYSKVQHKRVLILWLEIVSVHKMTVLFVHYNLKINFYPSFLILIDVFI